MENKTVFRVHPSINFARFGTSDDYTLSPETSAGLPQKGTDVTGGLPIKKGTEKTTVTSNDLRDEDGNLKKQAARFRIYAYDHDPNASYPQGGGTEVTINTQLPDGRVVVDIIWSCHLANKKAAAFNVVNNKGVKAYAPVKKEVDGKTVYVPQVPQLRNPETHGEVNSAYRLNRLMIDPGPRVIKASTNESAKFDDCTTPTCLRKSGQIDQLPDYPVRFPVDSNEELFEPNGPLDTLGEILTDDKGRLLVLPSTGNAVGQYDEYGVPIQMTGDLNNVGWFDSASDGPVSVTLVFDDGSMEEAFGAWVVCGDPGYAPQIRNVVSVWDDVYDTFVRQMGLQPELFTQTTKPTPENFGEVEGYYNKDYIPNFAKDIKPTFVACTLQRWTANLPEMALRAHTAVESEQNHYGSIKFH
jgi:hypothetical protein